MATPIRKGKAADLKDLVNVSEKDKNSSSIPRKHPRNFPTVVHGRGLTSTKLFSTLLQERIRLEPNSQVLLLQAAMIGFDLSYSKSRD